MSHKRQSTPSYLLTHPSHSRIKCPLPYISPPNAAPPVPADSAGLDHIATSKDPLDSWVPNGTGLKNELKVFERDFRASMEAFKAEIKVSAADISGGLKQISQKMDELAIIVNFLAGDRGLFCNLTAIELPSLPQGTAVHLRRRQIGGRAGH